METILQLFKRLLFSTCNILVSNDANQLKHCILGIIELFYPLTCNLVVIPNLPETNLEYVNMCSQCVIGVVKHNMHDTARRDSSMKVLRKHEGEKGQAKVLVNEEVIDLFEIMQDNSCQIDLKINYSIQKPKQTVGFNPKGRLAQG